MRSPRLVATGLAALALAAPILAQSLPEEVAAADDALRAGRPLEAVALARRSVELDPRCARCWSLLGRAQAQSRDYLEAERSLDRARDLGGDDPLTLLTLGSVLWENGDLDAAAALLASMVAGEDEPAFLAAHQLGRLRLWQGRYDEAADLLRPVVERRAGPAEALLDLARALEGLGDAAAARSLYAEYLAAVPSDAGALYGFARVCREVGETAAAEVALERYAELRAAEARANRESGRRQALLDQATHLLRGGRAAEVEELLVELAPNAAVLALRARALHAGGETAAARATLERAVALDPARADLRALLREWSLADGDPR